MASASFEGSIGASPMRAVDPEGAGGERELLGMGLGGERNAPGRAGQTERDVQHVIARGQPQARLREARLGDQRMRAIGIGVRGEDAPMQAPVERRAGPQRRRQPEGRHAGIGGAGSGLRARRGRDPGEQSEGEEDGASDHSSALPKSRRPVKTSNAAQIPSSA